jgi:anti-sigma regulatory factor (Ser/Thr protein kinase)
MTTGLASSQFLTSDVLAPRNARAYARVACDGLAPRRLVDDVMLVVSELVTNATTHGRGEIGLVLRVSDDEVFVAVKDRGQDLGASPLPADSFEEHGRGLVIVAEVASSWGVHGLGDAGKLVWCVVHAPERRANVGWTSPGIEFLLGASDRMLEPFATESAALVHN